MSGFQVICMSFEGDYKKEPYEFDTIEKTWDYANDLGSKWYFYPFCFVIKNRTIKDTPHLFEMFINKRIKTLSTLFGKLSKNEDAKGMDCEKFSFYVLDNFNFK